MNNTIDVSNAIQHEKDGPYAVAMDKGSINTRVSSQWWSRPDDQRFTSLSDLYEHTSQMAAESFAKIVDVSDIEVRSRSDDPEDLRLMLPEVETDSGAHPTHWSFGQLCSLLSSGGHNVPARYLRQLPGQLAAINLQYALSNFRSEVVKAYVRDNGRSELRAATGPEYGRIFDHEVVSAVQKIAGNGTGDSHWKVPGVLEWKAGQGTVYNPNAPITKQSTTLFASDRDVFMFLVDDKRPIEIGRLPNGEPDLLFRGFYVWNSEVGNRSIGIATFYLRGVCMNRILWGVEGFQEFSFRHSKNAPARFIKEAAPALEDFSNHNTAALLNGINTAREKVVARTDEERTKFLRKRGFGTKTTQAIIDTVSEEEGKAPESIWDFVQGITAVARSQGKQDARLSMEKEAQRLLDKVA